MNSTIILGREGATLSSSVFALTADKALELTFKSEYDLSEATLTLKNGAKTKTYDFKHDFTVPEEFLFAGRLCASVQMYVNGDLVKRWNLPPIRLKEEDKTLYAYDELNDLTRRIEALEEATKITL